MPDITTAYYFKPLYDAPGFLAILEKMNLSLPGVRQPLDVSNEKLPHFAYLAETNE